MFKNRAWLKTLFAPKAQIGGAVKVFAPGPVPPSGDPAYIPKFVDKINIRFITLTKKRLETL